MTTKLKIIGVPKDYHAMPFGRQLEYRRVIVAFKESAKSVHLSQKRQSNAKTIREALALYGATEYYCQFEDSQFCRDDSFQFWYR